MEVILLDIQNFLAIKKARLALTDRGLNVIQGENNEDSSATSNGSGKSSIFDALYWALFDQTSRGESGDEVVNLTAKKNCRVTVILRDGEALYRIIRGRKDSELKNSVQLVAYTSPASSMIDDKGRLIPVTVSTVDLTKGTDRETQVEIERVVGCSKEVFSAAVYAGQEQMPDLPRMTDKTLKTLIEEAAGVSRLSAAYEVARQKRATAETFVKELQLKEERFMKNITSLDAEYASAFKGFSEFDAERAAKEQAHRDAAAECRETVAKIVAKIKSKDGASLLARRDELQKHLSEHSAKAAELRKYTTEVIQPIERQIAKIGVTLDAEHAELDNLTTRASRAHEELANPCPECGKPHEESEVEHLRTILKGKIAATTDRLHATQAEHKKLHEKLEAAKIEAKRLESEIPDVASVSAQIAEVNQEIIALNSLKAQAREAKSQADVHTENAKTALTAENPYKVAVKMVEKRRNEEKEALTKNALDLVQALADFEIKKSVATVFGPAGVRAHILDTVTPFLNERTAEYLSILSDGHITAVWTTLSRTKAGELKEKFSIDVSNDTGAKSFKGLSGGEKRKVRIATMLALQDLVASRASKPINLWIGDEIDDALDASGLERLMTILEMKARERGTVIVISHEALTDWCDSVTVVTKKDGSSTVEGALCVE